MVKLLRRPCLSLFSLCLIFTTCFLLLKLFAVSQVHQQASQQVELQPIRPVTVKIHANCTCQPTARNRHASPVLKITPKVKEPEKFTVVIPTYKRNALLKKILANLCTLGYMIDCVIVVWNDVQVAIPQELLDFNCGVTLVFKKEKKNSLNNRFRYYREIRTEAVLSNDDDLLISIQDLAFLFESWKAFKHLIVGFTQRKHIESPKNSGKFIYGKRFTNEDCCYSIILTTSAMFHVQYLDLYNSFMTEEMHSFIDQNMNCEDLFMNAVVGKHLKDTIGLSCPGLLLQQRHIQRMEKENDSGYEGLWHRQRHSLIRDKCLNMIVKIFEGLPLDYSDATLPIANRTFYSNMYSNS